MKRTALLIVWLLLFVACKPAAPVITEEKADSDVLQNGIWFDPKYGGLVMTINGGTGSKNLTYSVYEMTGFYRTSGGTAKFEDGKFSYLTDFSICGDAPEATYEIYVVKEDGFITSMREEPVGSDGCPERAEASQDIYVYSGPAALSNGDERSPQKGGELLGLWYSEDGVLMIYTLKKLDLNAGITDIDIQFYDTKQDPWLELGKGTARYQDEKLTLLTNEGMCEGSSEVVYEVKMVDHNEKVIGILFTLIGDDACADRKNIMNDAFIWNVDP